MKAVDWMRLLGREYEISGKTVFTITELANFSGTPRASLHVQLNRLCATGVMQRYAHGLYGTQHVDSMHLLTYLDSGAYCTGQHALFYHALITQSPVVVTCFTNRHHGRHRVCRTNTATFEFVIPAAKIYSPPAHGVMASSAPALCDFVFLSLDRGVAPESIVTFRNLEKIDRADLHMVLSRYPSTVQKRVKKILRTPPL